MSYRPNIVPATASVAGVVKPGTGLTVAADGTLSLNYSYTLGAATTTTLGGVIVGSGLAVTSGTIAVAFGTTSGTAASGADPRFGAAEQIANKGQAGGYAGLDASGKLPTAQLPASVQGALDYQGVWNALTNSPALVSGGGTKGFYYTVGTAGSAPLDGISQWNIGDHAAFNGTAWEKLDGVASEVISVAGRTGVITLAASDIGGLGSAATLNVGTTTGTLPDAGVVNSALASKAPFSPPRRVNATTSAAITILAADGLVEINNTSGSPLVINLDANPSPGSQHRLKDVAGNASTYNWAVTPNTGTIDGTANFIMNQSWGSLSVERGTVEWSVI